MGIWSEKVFEKYIPEVVRRVDNIGTAVEKTGKTVERPKVSDIPKGTKDTVNGYEVYRNNNDNGYKGYTRPIKND